MKAHAEAAARAKLERQGKPFSAADLAHETDVQEQVLAYQAEVAAAHADASRSRRWMLGAAVLSGAGVWLLARR